MRKIDSNEKKIIKILGFILLAIIFSFGFACLIITKIPELQSVDFVKNYAPLISAVATAMPIALLAIKIVLTFFNLAKTTKKTNLTLEKIENETKNVKYNEEKKEVKNLISKKVDGEKVIEDDVVEIWKIKENEKIYFVIKSKEKRFTQTEIWNSIDKLSTQI